MLCRISLQILPESWGERVLARNLRIFTFRVRSFHGFSSVLRMQNTGQAWPLIRQLQVIPGKARLFFKADNNDPLSMLRYIPTSIYHFKMNVVTKLIAQSFKYYFES